MQITGQLQASQIRPDARSGNRERSGDPRSEARKPQSLTEALGQVFTPPVLAERMVLGLGLENLEGSVRMLDPSVGPDTFPAALRKVSNSNWLLDAIDVDPSMCRCVAASGDKRVKVEEGDYLSRPRRIYDAAILNPPYVRQEWLRDKKRVRSIVRNLTGVDVPGTSNLYVYFVVKVVSELRTGGQMACLVYDSWQSTLFGRWLKSYLDDHCVWRCEAVPDCPFEGRLIDATIIYATKSKSAALTHTTMTRELSKPGFADISALFTSRRGLRLKQADFFMTTIERQAEEGSTPFVKKIRKIAGFSVPSEHPEAALLVDQSGTDMRTIAAIERRLASARLSEADNVSILTWYAERPEAWYRHRPAPTDVILFNYYLRHRPKHIMNSDRSGYSDNFYGITPRDSLSPFAWLAALNASASVIGILRGARNQGAGLAKLQLFEYREAQVLDIRKWNCADLAELEVLGRQLADNKRDPNESILKIDKLVAKVSGDPDLSLPRVVEDLAESDRIAKRPVQGRF
jgi:adenine-specific DNA-methyltransferase